MEHFSVSHLGLSVITLENSVVVDFATSYASCDAELALRNQGYDVRVMDAALGNVTAVNVPRSVVRYGRGPTAVSVRSASHMLGTILQGYVAC